MHEVDDLSERESRVLEAVVQLYVETAEPAGSNAVARRSGLGMSPATIRGTMSELEVRGYLYHAHTSGGRIPTDRAYRLYVNRLMRVRPVPAHHLERIESEITPAPKAAIEEVLRRAAQVLGVLAQELGVALAPTLDGLVLERVELVRPSSERLLVVLGLQSGLVRTIFVEVPASVAPGVVEQVARILNERLGGLTLREIRASLADRLRDAEQRSEDKELLNVFVAQGEELFDLTGDDKGVLLGSAQPLVGQPEFASNDRMRELLTLTERRDLLRRAFEEHHRRGITITIGSEHDDPRLAEFTLVTSPYRSGKLSGVIGVLGPTRMPYDKVIGLVEQTSRMVEGLMS